MNSIDPTILPFQVQNINPGEIPSSTLSGREWLVDQIRTQLNHPASFTPLSTISSEELRVININIPGLAGEILERTPVYCSPEGMIELAIPFHQSELIARGLPAELNNFVIRFQGLCELICNYILIHDLLGKGDNSDFLRKEITVAKLEAQSILKSHLLDVYSVLQKVLAFLFGIYPNNIFSFIDQWRLVKKTEDEKMEVNKELLEKGLKKIEPGVTLKLEVVYKSKESFQGHSLLIKKVKDNEFIFFDPNSGEQRKLSVTELTQQINGQLLTFGGTDIFISPGEKYLNELRKKAVL